MATPRRPRRPPAPLAARRAQTGAAALARATAGRARVFAERRQRPPSAREAIRDELQDLPGPR